MPVTVTLQSPSGESREATFPEPPTQAQLEELSGKLFGSQAAPAKEGPSFLRRLNAALNPAQWAAEALASNTEAQALTAEIGAPILGGIAGAPLGPAGVVAGSVAGGVAGRAAANQIRGEEQTIRGLAASGVTAAIPGGVAGRVAKRLGTGLAKRAAVFATEGAVLGAAGDVVQTGLETGELPTAQSLVTSTLGGAAIGGTLGAATGRPKATVADEASQKAVDIAASQTGSEPVPVPPAGQRRIVLPGESVPPAPDEPVTLFGPDGKVVSEAAPILERRMSVPLSDALRDDVTRQAEEAATALSQLDPDVKKQRFFRQLNKAIRDGIFSPDETLATLDRHGWTMEDFFRSEVEGTFSEFEEGVSGAAKLMNRVKQEKVRIMAVLHADPETRKIMDGMAEAGAQNSGFSRLWQEFRDLDDAGRAAATGQMATMTRNLWTQAGRLLLDVPVDAIKRVLERAGFKTQVPAGNPLATFWGIAAASKPGDTDRLLAMLDRLGPEGEIWAKRIFGTSTSETPFVSGSKTGRPFRGLPATMVRTAKAGFRERRFVKAVLGPVADAAAAPNQLQENFFRRAAYQARLMQSAERRGFTWARIQEEPGLLPTEDWEDALQHSLEVTFAAQPQSKAGKQILSTMRLLQPLSTRFATYPRYMMNAGKFFMDFNPTGTLRLLSKSRADAIDVAISARRQLDHLRASKTLTPDKERQLLKVIEREPREGSADVIAKAVTGSALLGAAVMFRLSSDAGEKWDEIKSGPPGPDGQPSERDNIVGLAGPGLPYFFLGELIARQLRDDPTPRPIEARDFAQGLAGLRLSPGTKALFDAVADRKEAGEAAQDVLDKTVGEFLGMFSVPLRTVKDFMAAYGQDSEALYLDPREVLELGDVKTKLFNPTIQNVPGLGKALDRPASVSAATGKERGSIKTARRQISGLTAREVTPFQAELDRLGISEFDFVPASRSPKIDREMSRRVGALADLAGNSVVRQDWYRRLGPAQQRLVWNELAKDWRKKAVAHLEETNPQLFAARKEMNKWTKLKKEVAKETKGVDIDEVLFRFIQQAPGR